MTRLTLRRWAPRHVLLAWCGYWLALVLAVLGPPAVLTWGLTHDAGRHGSVSAGLRNDVVALTVTENGATRWAGHAPLLALALWIAVPPLLLYVAWWRSRPGRDAHARTAPPGESAAPVLHGGGPVLGVAEAPDAVRVPLDRGRDASDSGRRAP